MKIKILGALFLFIFLNGAFIGDVYSISEIVILQKRVESLEARVSYLENKLREQELQGAKKETGLVVEDYQGKEVSSTKEEDSKTSGDQSVDKEGVEKAMKKVGDLKGKMKEREDFLNDLMEE